MFRLNLENRPKYHQDGGGRIRSVETVIYIMLEIPTKYQIDINRLIQEFRVRYGVKFANSYDFQAVDPKHMTMIQANLILTDSQIKKLTNKWKRNKRLTLKKLHQDRTGKTFQKLKEYLEKELNDELTDILLDQFEDMPEDTTASCYPSKFNIYSKFLVVQYKPDLGFHAIIIPAIKEALYDYFNQGRGTIKMGKFYQDPKNIMLHISLAKEKYQSSPSKKIVKMIQSENRYNLIPAGLARNFVISYQILDSFANPVWVSLGSYGTFS